MESDQKVIKAVLEATEPITSLTAEETREHYSRLRNEREKATFSMMMRMNPQALTSIRKEFFVREDKVKVDEFIYIINKHLLNNNNGSNSTTNISTHNSFANTGRRMSTERKMSKAFNPKEAMSVADQREFGLLMYELFKEIDVNGDGDLEWLEFTSFTVERANILNSRRKLANLAHYYDSSDLLDASARVRHRHDIANAVVMKSINQFAIVEDHRNSIFIFSSRQGRLLHTITTESAPITIEYIPDREKDLLVATGADMTMSTYSLDDPNPNRRYQHLQSWATPGVQMALAYQPESKLVYSGGTNGNVYSWNIKERNLISTLTGHTDIVMSLTNISQLNNVASASLDKTISIWDSYTNERVLTLSGHRKGIFDMAYSQEYRLLVSCGFEHDAFVWSPFVNNLMGRLRGHHASLIGCVAIEGTPELITGDTNGVFKLWDVRNFNCVQTFSANDSNDHSKDNMKMSCFIHTSLPSRNSMQKEDDSRIYAASKMLTSFDQARIVHEATTDKTNVNWIVFNPDRSMFVTASERNIIVWDAFMGSAVVVNTNICGEEITACCLDDRKRKILIGDNQGNIGVYNLSNGALMKRVEKSNHSHYGTVVSLAYVNESKRFIAAYQYGKMLVYDENTMEECIFVRSFETVNRVKSDSNFSIALDGISKIAFNPRDHSVASISLASNYAKLWNYNTGKFEYELRACNDPKEYIVCVEFLHPYPIVVTCDSVGNVVFWGSGDSKWPGMRLAGFLNQNIFDGVYKQHDKLAHSFSEEVHPPMVIPPPHDGINTSPRVSPKMSRQPTSQSSATKFFGDERDLVLDASRRTPKKVHKGLNNDYLKILRMMDTSDSPLAQSSTEEVRALVDECEAKWGPTATVQSVCWHSERKTVFVGDDMGILRCFDIKDLLYDINAEQMLSPKNPDASPKYQARNYCQKYPRSYKSALPPCHKSYLKYFIGIPDNAMSYMGINFSWALVAHDDRIVTTYCTSTGILTSAVDRLVKMWTFDGDQIGKLLQSVPTGVKNKLWRLELDAAEIMKKESEELDAILVKVDELNHRSDNPDMDHSDFTGLEPGENAADFNRSQLRRRIDMTGKLLGLDFPSNNNKSSDDHCSYDTELAVAKLRRRSSNHEIDNATLHSLLSSHASSATTKSVVSAMKELKSTTSSIDYTTFNRSLTYRQRNTRIKKMNKLSNILIRTSEASKTELLSSEENNEIIKKANSEFENNALKGLKRAVSREARLDSASLMSASTNFNSLDDNDNQVNRLEQPSVSSSITELVHNNSSNSRPLSRGSVLQSSEDFVKESATNSHLHTLCSKYSSFHELEQALRLSEQPFNPVLARKSQPKKPVNFSKYSESKLQRTGKSIASASQTSIESMQEAKLNIDDNSLVQEGE